MTTPSVPSAPSVPSVRQKANSEKTKLLWRVIAYKVRNVRAAEHFEKSVELLRRKKGKQTICLLLLLLTVMTRIVKHVPNTYDGMFSLSEVARVQRGTGSYRPVVCRKRTSCEIDVQYGIGRAKRVRHKPHDVGPK